MTRPYESETIERLALTDIHEAATDTIATQLRLQAICEGTSVMSIAAGLPASAIVINRCLGLGLQAPITRSTIRKIVAAYADSGVQRYFVQIHPDANSPELQRWLGEAGLVKARGWQKFTRAEGPPPSVSTALTIEQVGVEHGEAFAGIVCDAFDLGEQARDWLALLPGRPDWHVFMSFDGGEPAGCGALFIDGEAAWSDFGATAPAFRRRGSQGALLARRIDYAMALGCKRIHTCTGEDVAGDPQHSFANILRMGFEPTYVRENWSPVQP